MRDWLFRHRLAALSTLLIILPILLMYLSGNRRTTPSGIQNGLISLTGWAQTGFGGVTQSVGGVTSDITGIFSAVRENSRLVAENSKLLGESLNSKRLAVENRDLRLLLGFREQRVDLKLAAASVVVRDVNPFFRIERLRVVVDGKTPPASDMAVIIDTGLVGRVTSASGRFADVMLLTDTRSRVACQVMGTGVLGMVVGSGSKTGYQARLQISMNDSLLQKGATIVTSGHDRVFPRGIEVGYLIDPEARRQVGPFMEYDIALAVDPAVVSHAMIVTDLAAADAGDAPEDR